MGGEAMFKAPEITWVDHWSRVVAKRGAPIVAEVRYDLQTLYGISLAESKFSAKVLIYVRVHTNDLYKEGERKARAQEPYYVDGPGGPIQEWTPWLEVQGTVVTKSWTREDFTCEQPRLVFAYEIEGTFPLGANERGHLFPFDFHELSVAFTSNWDAEKLLFVPWDSEWDVSQAERPLGKAVEIVDDTISRVRSEEVDNSLKHKWKYSATPLMQFTSSSGFTRYTYSEVSGMVLVRRVWVTTMLYEVLRPFMLAMIAPTSIYILPDTSSRLGFNVSILVAMSVAFMTNSNGGRITQADWYRLALFFFAAFVLVLAVFPEISQGFNDNGAGIIAWVALIAVHGAFLVFQLFLLPFRLAAIRRFTPSKSSSLSARTNSLAPLAPSASSFQGKV